MYSPVPSDSDDGGGITKRLPATIVAPPTKTKAISRKAQARPDVSSKVISLPSPPAPLASLRLNRPIHEIAPATPNNQSSSSSYSNLLDGISHMDTVSSPLLAASPPTNPTLPPSPVTATLPPPCTPTLSLSSPFPVGGTPLTPVCTTIPMNVGTSSTGTGMMMIESTISNRRNFHPTDNSSNGSYDSVMQI